MATKENEVYDQVKDYYGMRVKNQDDLQTKACISNEGGVPAYIREIFSMISDEVATRYFDVNF